MLTRRKTTSSASAAAIPAPPKTRKRGRLPLAFGALALLAGGVVIPMVGPASGTVTGTVWRDYTFEGSRSSLEPGVADIIVNAYDDDGTLVGTTTSTADGSYTLNISGANANNAVRVEFVLPAALDLYLNEGPIGPDNGSSVQFAPIGAAGVDFAVVNPADYTLDNPDLVIPVQRSGEAENQRDAQPDTGDVYDNEASLVSFPYTATGASQDGGTDPTEITTTNETGNIYGLAYDNEAELIYAAAYLKRHTDLGPGGLDAIYIVDPVTEQVTLFGHDVNTDPANLMPDPRDSLCIFTPGRPEGCLSYDDEVFGLVGKIGWGDIEMSEDNTTLWGVNLGTRELVAMPIADPTNETTYSQPADLVCNNGVARPFAVEPHDGLIYTGWVCSGESLNTYGGVDSDLIAYVYPLDPVTGTWGPVAATIPLNYDRYGHMDTQSTSLGAGWEPWVDTLSTAGMTYTSGTMLWQTDGTGDPNFPSEYWARPQPMLNDIAFDWDGSMIVSFRDRGADQLGWRNYLPIEGDTTIVSTVAFGDVLRLAPPQDGTGQYRLENDGVVFVGTTTDTLSGNTVTDGLGPGGSEFYADGYGHPMPCEYCHPDTLVGGILLEPGLQADGYTELLAVEMDPVDTRYDAAGVTWFNNTTGGEVQQWETYQDDTAIWPDAAPWIGPPLMGKANGLGDLIALTVPAPVEIGNRIWFDADGDGIQDPSEPAMAGVTVELYAAGATPGVDAPIATAVTDANGNYVFSSNIEQSSSASFIYGLTELVEGAEFQIVVPTTTTVNGESAVLTSTDQTSLSDGLDDTRDSDVDTTTGITIQSVIIGDPGTNDHTWDIGYTVSKVYDLALVKVVNTTDPVTQVGQEVSWTIRVYNQGEANSGPFTVTDQIPTGMSYLAGSATVTGPIGLASETVNGDSVDFIFDDATGLNAGEFVDITFSTVANDLTVDQYRNWAEISADSAAELYASADEDSTPDTNTGQDGTLPNDGYTPIDNLDDAALDNVDGTDEDDNDDAMIAVQTVYDLALVKTVDVTAPVPLGGQVNYTVTVANQGNVPSGEFTVVDQLPAGATYDMSSHGGVYDAATHTVTWTVANLAPGETVPLTLTVTISEVDINGYRNWAEITDDSAQELYATNDEDSTPDTNTGIDNTLDGVGDGPNDDVVNHNDITADTVPGDEDDNDFEDVTVEWVYDLALAKVTSDGAVDAVGDAVTWTIRVKNQGTLPSGPFSVTDTIPTGMVYVDGLATVTDPTSMIPLGTVDVAGSTVTFNFADATGLTSGAIVDISFQTQVTDLTAGPFRNWTEISADSGTALYGVADKDSTPDSNTGADQNLPNDDYVPVDQLTDTEIDQIAGDEDDNDDAVVDAITYYDLALIKTASSSTVMQGGDITWTITIANQGNIPSGAYDVTDVIPAGMDFVSADPAPATVSGRTLTWTGLPSIAAGELTTITVVTKAVDLTAAPFVNWAEISADSGDDQDSTPDTNVGDDNGAGTGTMPNDEVVDHNDITLDEPAGDEDDNDLAVVDASLEYDLALVKVSTNTGPVEPTDTITWQIAVMNQGNVDSREFVITDTIPAGLTFGSADNGGVEAGGVVTWTIPNLAPGEMVTVSFTTTINDLSLAPFRNWAEISSDSSAAYNTTDADSTPDANTGSDAGAGTGTLPNDAYIGIDDLADVAIDQVPGDEDDNDDAIVAVNIDYDLALVKVADATTVEANEGISWTIRVQNQGNVASGPVTVTDTLPAGLIYTGSTGGAGSSLSGNTVTWQIANIPVGGYVDLTMSTAIMDATQAPFRNWAEISSDSAADYGVTDQDSAPDTNTGQDNTLPNDAYVGLDSLDDAAIDQVAGDEDDNDDALVNVVIRYDLALIKTLVDEGPYVAGDTVTYTITTINQGNVPSGGYTVQDVMPGGFSFVSASNGGQYADGVVTWTMPNLAAGASANVTVTFQIDDITKHPYRNWAEITDDSSEVYGVTDEDSTPDTNIGSDNELGYGDAPNDAVVDHNDPNFDSDATTPLAEGSDEDDNDYADVDVFIDYDLALVKVADVSVLEPGGSVTFTIRVANQGNVPSGEFTFIDVLPGGLAFVSADQGGSEDAGVVTWVVSNLNPGETFEVNVTATLTDVTARDFRNWAEIIDDSAAELYAVADGDSTPDTDTGNDAGAGTGTMPNDAYVGLDNLDDVLVDQVAGDEDDNDDAIVTANVEYDLALAKVVNASGPVEPGSEVVWTIRVKNQGNVPSNDFVVTDTIPTGMTFVTADNMGVNDPFAGTVTWTVTNLDPGATIDLTVTTKVVDPTAGPFTNWAEISDDSSEDYGVTDSDSTPDLNTGQDNNLPNDPFVDNTLADVDTDQVPGDEDDNDAATIAVNIVYDLALVKVNTNVGTIQPTDDLTFTIRVLNQGNVPSGVFTVTDTIPAGTVYKSSSIAATATGNDVSWTLPSLAPGEYTDIDVVLGIGDVTKAPFENFAEISDDSSDQYGINDSDSTPDGDTTNDDYVDQTDLNDVGNNPDGDEDDHDGAVVSVNVVYDLALVKVNTNDATIKPGDDLTYTLRVKNQGNVPSGDFTVTDSIPTGTELKTASNGGTVVDGNVVWNLTNLAPGQSADLNLVLAVTDVSQSPFRNWAEISSDSASDYGVTDVDSTPDTNTGSNDTLPNDDYIGEDKLSDVNVDRDGDEDDNDDAVINIPAVYDLSLVKVNTNAPSMDAGDDLTYTIRVQNQGNLNSGDFTVTDTIPTGTAFKSATNGGAVVDGKVVWNLTDLAPGEFVDVKLVLAVTDISMYPFRNWAEITDDSASDYNVVDIDSTPDNNTGSDDTLPNDDYIGETVLTGADNDIVGDEDDNDDALFSLEAIYDLALVKVNTNDATILLGDDLTYTIRVANQGNVDSGEVEVTDTIPSGTAFKSSNPEVASVGAGLVTWKIGNIPAGEYVDITIVLEVIDAGQAPFRNWAEISADSAGDYNLTDTDSTPDGDTGVDDILPNDEYIGENSLDDVFVDRNNDEDDNDDAIVGGPVNYDLALVKFRDMDVPVTVGGDVYYTLRVANQGNVDSGAVQVTDYIPNGMVFINASHQGAVTAQNTVVWDIANIAPNEVIELKVTLRLVDGTIGVYRNIGEITDDSSEQYGVEDNDSTPDEIKDNDDIVDHNNIDEDNVPGDEDDSDIDQITVDQIAQPQPKPTTGSNAAPIAGMSMLLAAAGAAMLLFGRRRRRLA